MSRHFKTFAEYWEWAKHLPLSQRKEYVNSLDAKEMRRLRRDYFNDWESYFLAGDQIYNLDDYFRWASDKSVDERLKLIASMEVKKKRSLISQKRRKMQNMNTPRYEFRFQNSDIFFSDSQDHELSATAIIVADHIDKTIVKNRHGSNGSEAYQKLFPPTKHVNQTQFAITANLRIEQNADNLEVWSEDNLVSIIKPDGDAQFDVWRLLGRLSRLA